MRLDYDSPESIAAATEALLFASDDPLSAAELRSLLLGEEHRPATLAGDTPLLDQPEEEQTSRKRKTLELSTIKTAIEQINTRLVSGESPYHVVEIAGGYQFATKPDYAVFVSRLYKEKSRRRLSGAALETLAIIAYKQPVSKPDVENIRGVNCDEVLKSLLEKNLITITGRSESVGKPLLYGTTDDFLRHFGLPSVKDLPKPREIEEMMKDESVKATTLDEAADEFVDPDASDSITVDEVIAVDKEENTEALAETAQAEELA